MEEIKTTTEDLIREILEESKASISAQLKESIKQQVINQLSWSLREEIGKIASAFVTTELSEEIKAAVLETKPQLIAALKEAFIKIGANVAIAMYETASKNLAADNYRTKELLKKILE
jgi:putative aminopeptidase FrvX